MSYTRIKKFFSYYRPYRRLLLADLLCALVVAGCALLLPLLARAITQAVLADATPAVLPEVYRLGAAMLLLVALMVGCNLFVDYRGHMMGGLMEADMRRELFAHYEKLSFRFYDEQKTGQLMTRLTHDTWMLSELYHHGPEDLLIAALKFGGAFFILFQIDAGLTTTIFLLLPPAAAYAWFFGRRMIAALRISRDRIGDANAQVEDTLAGIRVVASFTNEAVEAAKFERANRRLFESRRDGYRSEAYFDAGMKGFAELITVAVVVLGAIAIVRGDLHPADLLTYLLYVALLIDPILRMVNLMRLSQEGLTGFGRVMEMLEVPPAIQDRPGARPLADVRGEIEFRAVSFRYREGHDHVLKNVDLHIPAGEYVALVGPSGAGKTTLCSLIPRFYEVSAGAILLDGVDIRNLQLNCLRRSIGVVQQDVYLFAGSVADNIRYGKLDASMEEIVAAARQANAHDFIMALPDGYETDIGQRGVKLSGGQKQRLSIARVFLKNPAVLLFDEATSALDSENEEAVRQSLERLAAGRTTLVIAHRLSTIRHATRILVLTEEGIEEQGAHADLLAAGGVYADLHRAQNGDGVTR